MVHEKSFMNIIDGIFVGFFSHKKSITLTENWITVLTLSSSIKHFWRHWDHSQVKSAPNCCLMYGLNFYPPNIHVSGCRNFLKFLLLVFLFPLLVFGCFSNNFGQSIYFVSRHSMLDIIIPSFETISLFSWILLLFLRILSLCMFSS